MKEQDRKREREQVEVKCENIREEKRDAGKKNTPVAQKCSEVRKRTHQSCT